MNPAAATAAATSGYGIGLQRPAGLKSLNGEEMRASREAFQ